MKSVILRTVPLQLLAIIKLEIISHGKADTKIDLPEALFPAFTIH